MKPGDKVRVEIIGDSRSYERALGKNQNVSPKELESIRGLDDFDLVMLVSEINDHGWQIARRTLELMHREEDV